MWPQPCLRPLCDIGQASSSSGLLSHQEDEEGGLRVHVSIRHMEMFDFFERPKRKMNF